MFWKLIQLQEFKMMLISSGVGTGALSLNFFFFSLFHVEISTETESIRIGKFMLDRIVALMGFEREEPLVLQRSNSQNTDLR